MEIRDLIGGLRVLIVVAILSIGALITFAITNFDSIQNQQGTDPDIDPVLTEQKSESQNAAEQLPGFQLFKEWGCNACHAVDRKLVGPALLNIRDRRPDEWLQKFIKNSAAMIASDDAYAVALYKEYNQTPMPNHALSNEEVTSILDYITKASK